MVKAKENDLLFMCSLIEKLGDLNENPMFWIYFRMIVNMNINKHACIYTYIHIIYIHTYYIYIIIHNTSMTVIWYVWLHRNEKQKGNRILNHPHSTRGLMCFFFEQKQGFHQQKGETCSGNGLHVGPNAENLCWFQIHVQSCQQMFA